MIPGETILSGAKATCPDCLVTPKLQVYETNAFYVGTWCNCGPYSRETDYFGTREEAEEALRELEDAVKNDGVMPNFVRD